MKIHITLVGGQPEPIYYGIKYANPEKILFVHSSDEKSKEYAGRISSLFPDIVCEMKKFDPVDMNDIIRKANSYADLFVDDEVSINISGGTKPWAYYFTKIFGERPTTSIFYVDQKNNVWNLTNQTKDVVDFDMDVAISLYGNQIASKTDFNTVDKDDLKVIQEIEALRIINKPIFCALVAAARRMTNVTYWTCSQSSLSWNSKAKQFEFFITSSNGMIKKTLHSPNIYKLLINAGWFEYEIAKILREWERSVNVYVGSVFKFANKSAKNEIDIIVNIGNRLVFVECKTQIEQYTDIDKFRSAMRNYSGTSTIGLFVTREEMDDRAKEKCRDNGLLMFSVAECEKAGKDIDKSLINLLEDKVNKINAR